MTVSFKHITWCGLGVSKSSGTKTSYEAMLVSFEELLPKAAGVSNMVHHFIQQHTA